MMRIEAQDVVMWLILAGLVAISASPTIAGMLARASLVTPLVWAGWLSPEVAEAFALTSAW